MNSKPLVSVIMPVYNGEDYLQLTMRSILDQEFQDLEFIIINDGSDDGSENIILSFSDSRIRYVRNDMNRGLIYSLNLGVDVALGKYIARIDADDVADKGRLKKQFRYLEKHPDIALCGTYYKIIDKKGATVEHVELPQTDRDIRTYLLFGNCFCHSSIMIRTKVMQRLGYSQSYHLCEDYDLWFRVMLNHRVVNLPSFDTDYRVHGENISTRKRDEMLRCVKNIHGRALRLLQIRFSEQELILHNALLSFDHVRCMQFEKQEMIAWAAKLSGHIANQRGINKNLALKVFIRRWVTVCLKARAFGLLVNNPLLKGDVFFYMQCAFGKLWDKCLNRNRGLDL